MRLYDKFFQKVLDRYQLFGYQEKKDMRDNEKGYCYDDYRKCLKIYKIYNTSYRNSLSGYRWNVPENLANSIFENIKTHILCKLF